MEFACSLCGYTSEIKQHIKTHINNKNKCSEAEGEAEILEIPVDIICEFCQKEFSTKPNLKRHLKICKVKKIDLEKEVQDLRKQLDNVNKKLAQKSTALTTINSNVIINNNIIIQLRPYNDPKLPNDADMDDIFEDAWIKKKSIPTFVERLHLNDDLPENHNMCIPNLKTKLAKVFTEQGWITRDEDNFLDEIIAYCTHLLDKWVRAKKHRMEYENDFIEYLEIVGKKKFNEDTKKELRLMLYDAHKNGTVNIKSSTKSWIPVQDETS